MSYHAVCHENRCIFVYFHVFCVLFFVGLDFYRNDVKLGVYILFDMYNVVTMLEKNKKIFFHVGGGCEKCLTLTFVT